MIKCHFVTLWIYRSRPRSTLRDSRTSHQPLSFSTVGHCFSTSHLLRVRRPPCYGHLYTLSPGCRHRTTRPAWLGEQPAASFCLSSLRWWLLHTNWRAICPRRGQHPGDGRRLAVETWRHGGWYYRYSTVTRWPVESVVQSHSTGRSWWNDWRKRVDC